MGMSGERFVERVKELEDGDKDGVIELMTTFIDSHGHTMDPDVEEALYMIKRGKGLDRDEEVN